jgi:hypothetical protein
MKRAHCKKQPKENYIDFSKMPSDMKFASLLKLTAQRIDLSNKEKEAMFLKKINQHKQCEIGIESNMDNMRQTLFFHRLLGHKLDINGSGQWKMITKGKKA